MSDFHFLRPNFFFLLLPLALLLFVLWRRKLVYGGWGQVCDKHLLPYILHGEAKKSRLAFAALCLTGVLAITALAGPTWERVALPLIQEKTGLVIALDLSPAMNSEDVKPSRLKRALYKVSDILKKRREGQTALIVYTDEAFVVTPLTDDVKTISALLHVLDTGIMPTHGLNHDKAVAKAAELLQQAGINNGSLLLITSSFGEFSDAGIPVSILGVGTEQGAPVPKAGGGFLLDDKGGVIISKMERGKLSKLAESTGGRFASLSADESDIRYLLQAAPSNSYGVANEQVHWQWLDGGYWLVLFSLPLAAFLLRRGNLSLALLLFAFNAEAGVWRTKDQTGQRLFNQEAYAAAAEEFENPGWQGAAHYKAKNYEAAARCFKQDGTPDGYYNLGNCLAMQGQIDEAIAAYEKALELDPDHEDAAFNKKILEEKKKNQQNQQNQDKQNQDKQNQDKQNQDKQNQDKQNQDQQNQDEQKQDQQDSEQKDTDQQPPENQPEIKPEDKEEYSEEVDKEMKEQPKEQEEQMAEADPQREIDNRWLDRVPDDPGGLLRRKFLYQYKKGRS